MRRLPGSRAIQHRHWRISYSYFLIRPPKAKRLEEAFGSAAISAQRVSIRPAPCKRDQLNPRPSRVVRRRANKVRGAKTNRTADARGARASRHHVTDNK